MDECLKSFDQNLSFLILTVFQLLSIILNKYCSIEGSFTSFRLKLVFLAKYNGEKILISQ